MSWFKYIKLLWTGKGAANVILKEANTAKEQYEKEGWKSTEFWTAALAGLAAVAAQASGFVPAPYGVIVAAGSAALYQISRGLAKMGDPEGGVKPGQGTSEFWVNIITQVGSVSAASAGAVDPQVAGMLMMVSNGCYGLARGLAKGGAQPQLPS